MKDPEIVSETSSMTKPYQIAADVLETEISGLAALRREIASEGSALSLSFNAAVERCSSLSGRLILTGMGKSGHVARKIAATFASTGTPALFVHPGEASHGDLGMIARDDLIVALSYSGETVELRDIVAHASRFSITLIAITNGQNSALAEASDICLLLPDADEACIMTPAPTTSTTMMIALGDAMAVAALRYKGFTSEDFTKFHPGGKLGAALKRATDLMHHTDLPLCAPEDDIAAAIATMSDRGFGCVGVIDQMGAIVGIVTDGDLRRHYQRVRVGGSVGDIMTKAPQTVSTSSFAGEVLSLFSTKKITAIFIVDAKQRPVGLVHVHDCLSTGIM